MERKEDLYKVLGISRNSTLDEIKRVYKRLALEWHPDKNDDPELKDDFDMIFKQIGEAYKILSDPEKRKIYDRFGFQPFQNEQYLHLYSNGYYNSFNNPFPQNNNPILDQFLSPKEVFCSFFGHKFGTENNNNNNDENKSMLIDFFDKKDLCRIYRMGL